jgi:transposase, IS5 family
MQFFCGIQLKPAEVIKDTDLPSYWRSYIGQHLGIDIMQKKLVQHWKPRMEHTNFNGEDATCYESRISHPAPVKLVWDCCNKTWLSYNKSRKQLKLRSTRCNYEDRKKEFLSYQKSKKKTKRGEKKLLKKLLKFLLRLLNLRKELAEKKPVQLSLKQAAQLRLIIRVYEQQHSKVYGRVEQIKDRIVSLSKPYIRPFVRGKENKTVELACRQAGLAPK